MKIAAAIISALSLVTLASAAEEVTGRPRINPVNVSHKSKRAPKSAGAHSKRQYSKAGNPCKKPVSYTEKPSAYGFASKKASPSPTPSPKPVVKPAPQPPPTAAKPSPKPAAKPSPKPAAKPAVTTKKPAAAPSPAPRKDGNSGLSGQAAECLSVHNFYRGLVGSRALSWSRTLEASATAYAKQLTGRAFQHSSTPFGENLDRLTGGVLTCTHGLKTFFDEFKFYDGRPIQDDALFEKYGHFTQVVWPATTQVGCGIANNGNEYNLVCHYNPAGNVIGQRAPVYRG
ncbi:hypothetical protein HK105_201579 [Polyrhizophydium stewartii]|uniref:SCP domain-containing protein n=1 Tax=Polyrhizophydium stewartii TaxID=2732419 RepID=A0ABR4NGT9_9FUNG